MSRAVGVERTHIHTHTLCTGRKACLLKTHIRACIYLAGTTHFSNMH